MAELSDFPSKYPDHMRTNDSFQDSSDHGTLEAAVHPANPARNAFLRTQSAETVEDVRSKSVRTLESIGSFPYLSKTRKLSRSDLDNHIWDPAFSAGISSELFRICKIYNHHVRTEGEKAVAGYIGNAVNAYAWLCRKPEVSFSHPVLLEFLPKFAEVTNVVVSKNPVEAYERILKHSENLAEWKKYDWVEWIRSLPH